MKITITSTQEFAHVEGVLTRVWDGITEAGVPCKVYVPLIAADGDVDPTEFDRDLFETLEPDLFPGDEIRVPGPQSDPGLN